MCSSLLCVFAVRGLSLVVASGGLLSWAQAQLPDPWGILIPGPGIKPMSPVLQSGFFFLSFFYFSLKGNYDIVLVSAIHHHGSAMGVRMSLPCWASLPPPSPSRPSRLSQSLGLSSLSHPANPRWLSILHMLVYVSMLFRLHLSHPLLPTPAPTMSVSLFSVLCLHSCPANRLISSKVDSGPPGKSPCLLNFFSHLSHTCTSHTHTYITFKTYHYARDIVVSGPLSMSSNTFLTTLFNGVTEFHYVIYHNSFNQSIINILFHFFLQLAVALRWLS